MNSLFGNFSVLSNISNFCNEIFYDSLNSSVFYRSSQTECSEGTTIKYIKWPLSILFIQHWTSIDLCQFEWMCKLNGESNQDASGHLNGIKSILLLRLLLLLFLPFQYHHHQMYQPINCRRTQSDNHRRENMSRLYLPNVATHSPDESSHVATFNFRQKLHHSGDNALYFGVCYSRIEPSYLPQTLSSSLSYSETQLDHPRQMRKRTEKQKCII